MGVYVYPPVALSVTPFPPTTVLNPDGSEAQFNFAQTEDGIRVDNSTLSAVPIVLVAALAAPVKRIVVKNDSGNDLFIQAAARPKILIPKGADFDEVDFFGDTGEAVTIATVSGSGTAGTFSYFNFLG